MNILRSFHDQLVLLTTLAGLICLAVSGAQMVEASPIPRIQVPIIWEQVGLAHDIAWGVNAKEWLYLEFGEVRSLKPQVLREDLLGSGWSGFSIYDSIKHLDVLDSPLNHMLLIDRVLFDWDSPGVSIEASQGLWQLVIYIANERDNGEYLHDENAHPYVAIITHDSHLRSDINRLVINGYQAVPGSELVDAYFYRDEGLEVELYQFKTMSPPEAVIAHHVRMDWDIYPLGILGTFGYSEKDSLLLNVRPPSEDLEGTLFTIVYHEMPDLGEDGEW